VKLKKIISFLALILVGFITVSITAADSNGIKDWKYSKKIIVQGNSKYKELTLDSEVYRHSGQNLEDLRIVDSKGGFVPYYLKNGYSDIVSESRMYDSEIIREFNKDNNTFIDFKIRPQKENTDILGTRLSFSAGDARYLKTVEISGSYDGVEWNPISKETIYSVDNVKKDEVDLGGVKRFTFYRVMIPNNLEKLSIKGLKVKYDSAVVNSGKFEGVTGLKYELYNTARESVLAVYNPDRLRIRKLDLNVDGNFKRNFSVDIKKAYTFVTVLGNAEIYRMKFNDINIAKTGIEFSGKQVDSEEILVTILNQDDKPLDIKGIDAVYSLDKIVFEAEENETYSLIFGNTEAMKPSYDIEKFREHVESEKKYECSLASMVEVVKEDEGKKQEPKDLSWMLNIVIALVALAIIFILVGKLKKDKQE
jgi:hypothetical protein